MCTLIYKDTKLELNHSNKLANSKVNFLPVILIDTMYLKVSVRILGLINPVKIEKSVRFWRLDDYHMYFT